MPDFMTQPGGGLGSPLAPPVSAPAWPDERPAGVLSVAQFIGRHAELIGLTPDALARQCTKRLRTHPVHYANVLDGIALLRALVPNILEYPEAHYALVLTGQLMTGLIWIPAEHRRVGAENNLLEYPSESRLLIRSALELGADRLLLVSTRTDGDYLAEEADLRRFERLRTTLDLFGIELLDYLFFYVDLNVSCGWAQDEEGLDEGVSIDALELHYVSGFNQSSTDR